MEDIKEVIAENLTRLRQQAGLTQLQLADLLNYSDKAVSKWERGESVPDIRVLVQLADLYHITVDDIVREPHEQVVKPRLNLKKKHLLISLLSAGLAWVVAAAVFMILFNIQKDRAYLAFVVAPLAASIVLTVFSIKWGSRMTTLISSSALIWSVVCILHVFIWQFADGVVVWPFYLAACVMQLMLVGWIILRKLYKPKNKN